jgi:hypothetical protein
MRMRTEDFQLAEVITQMTTAGRLRKNKEKADKLFQHHESQVYNGRDPQADFAKEHLLTQIEKGNTDLTLNDIDALFDIDGKLKPQLDVYRLERAMAAPLPEFILIVAQMFEAAYRPVQTQLDFNSQTTKDGLQHGYNNHELQTHILDGVVRLAVQVMQENGYSEFQIKQYILSFIAHDVGNFYSRSLHALCVLPHCSRSLLGVEDASRVEWLETALTPATAHDEKVIKELLAEILNHAPNQESFFFLIEQLISPGLAALWVGDKLDVSWKRVLNTRQLTPTSLMDDNHFLANVFSDGVKVTKDPRGRSYLVSLPFDIYPDKEFTSNLPSLSALRSTQDGYKKPTQVFQGWSEDDQQSLTYFEQWYSTITDIYHDRLLIAALGLMRLSNVEEVRFNFYDKAPHKPIEVTRNRKVITYTKATLFKEIQKSFGITQSVGTAA